MHHLSTLELLHSCEAPQRRNLARSSDAPTKLHGLAQLQELTTALVEVYLHRVFRCRNFVRTSVAAARLIVATEVDGVMPKATILFVNFPSAHDVKHILAMLGRVAQADPYLGVLDA